MLKCLLRDIHFRCCLIWEVDDASKTYMQTNIQTNHIFTSTLLPSNYNLIYFAYFTDKKM
jgi:hypothetical protein